MARLVHATTGVVVDVEDGLIQRLGSEWAPAEAPEKEPKQGARKQSKK